MTRLEINLLSDLHRKQSLNKPRENSKERGFESPRIKKSLIGYLNIIDLTSLTHLFLI